VGGGKGQEKQRVSKSNKTKEMRRGTKNQGTREGKSSEKGNTKRATNQLPEIVRKNQGKQQKKKIGKKGLRRKKNPASIDVYYSSARVQLEKGSWLERGEGLKGGGLGGTGGRGN